jgi:hypothetical protein
VSTASNAVVITPKDPANGTVNVTAGNTITTTPSLNFAGTDQFSYTISANGVVSAPATVTINVVGNPAISLVSVSRARVRVRGNLTATAGPRLVLNGLGPPIAPLTILVDGNALATVQTNRRGRWRFSGRGVPGLTNPEVISVISAGSPGLNVPLVVF